MDPVDWDERYRHTDLMWGAEPNRWVEQWAAALAPGRALDLAAGEGRNAIWLASRGWDTLAVDFSAVAVDRARTLAGASLGPGAGRLRAEVRDVVTWVPPGSAFDLVVLCYLHLPPSERLAAVRAAAGAVARGGRLCVVGHDSANLAEGVGGPQDLTVLFTPADIVDDLAGTGMSITHARTERRPVQTETGAELTALDAVVVATRP
ncbi:MAG TPA: class I SAM-dependent methyltransferase [Candidatus Lustribacter sp.]|nr:class I SAM-dependent methyltransferase [Candidatus Lustribacter sp.]